MTLPAVLSGAAVDAINPCAFAVLIILITAVLGAGGRQRALYAGLAFSLSIFVSYYLMGLGLYSAVEAAGITQGLYLAVAVLAILIGLLNLKDYPWYGKWFVMEVPLSWRPKLKRLIPRHVNSGCVPDRLLGQPIPAAMHVGTIHCNSRPARQDRNPLGRGALARPLQHGFCPADDRDHGRRLF